MSEQIKQFKRDRDAYGHEIMDYLETGDSIEIIERDDGFMDAAAHVGVYFADFANWNPCEQEAMQYLLPGRSLDLGSGAGRVELYLQSRGMEAVGIDNSPLAVEVCRRRGVVDARVMSITQVSREKLGLFSNILMLGNNWGLMGSYKRAKWLLRKFYHMTTPEARIIAETNDVYKTDNPIHLAYQAYNRERGRMSGQIGLRVLRGHARSDWFDYLMVSKEEMCDILDGTGWKVMKFIDSPESVYVAVIEKVA